MKVSYPQVEAGLNLVIRRQASENSGVLEVDKEIENDSRRIQMSYAFLKTHLVVRQQRLDIAGVDE